MQGLTVGWAQAHVRAATTSLQCRKAAGSGNLQYQFAFGTQCCQGFLGQRNLKLTLGGRIEKKMKRQMLIPSSGAGGTFFYMERQHRKEKQASKSQQTSCYSLWGIRQGLTLSF